MKLRLLSVSAIIFEITVFSSPVRAIAEVPAIGGGEDTVINAQNVTQVSGNASTKGGEYSTAYTDYKTKLKSTQTAETDFSEARKGQNAFLGVIDSVTSDDKFISDDWKQKYSSAYKGYQAQKNQADEALKNLKSIEEEQSSAHTSVDRARLSHPVGKSLKESQEAVSDIKSVQDSANSSLLASDNKLKAARDKYTKLQGNLDQAYTKVDQIPAPEDKDFKTTEACKSDPAGCKENIKAVAKTFSTMKNRLAAESTPQLQNAKTSYDKATQALNAADQSLRDKSDAYLDDQVSQLKALKTMDVTNENIENAETKKPDRVPAECDGAGGPDAPPPCGTPRDHKSVKEEEAPSGTPRDHKSVKEEEAPSSVEPGISGK